MKIPSVGVGLLFAICLAALVGVVVLAGAACSQEASPSVRPEDLLTASPYPLSVTIEPARGVVRLSPILDETHSWVPIGAGGEPLRLTVLVLSAEEPPAGKVSLGLVEVEPGSLATIWTAPDSDTGVFEAVASSGWVAWVAGSPPLTQEDWTLFVYDLASGRLHKLAEGDLPPLQGGTIIYRMAPSLSLFNHELVWNPYERQASGEICSVIKITDLENLTESIVAREPDIQNARLAVPRLNERFVVWDRQNWDVANRTEKNDIYLFDRSTGITEAVTTDGRGLNPALGGRYLAYQHSLGLSQYEIRLMDIENGSTRVVSPPEEMPRNWHPSIGTSFVTWSRFSRDRVDVYDLSKDQVLHFDEEREVSNVFASGNAVIWTALPEAAPGEGNVHESAAPSPEIVVMFWSS